MQTADVFFVKYACIFDVFNSPKFLFGMFTYLAYFDVFLKFFKYAYYFGSNVTYLTAMNFIQKLLLVSRKILF